MVCVYGVRVVSELFCCGGYCVVVVVGVWLGGVVGVVMCVLSKWVLFVLVMYCFWKCLIDCVVWLLL